MQLHSAESLCARVHLLVLLSAMGCSPSKPPAPAPKVLSKFNVAIVPGLLTHDVVLTNDNLRNLEQIDLKATVYFENDEVTVTRHWAYWKHDSTQTINVPAGTTAVQRIVIKGTAVNAVGKESVELSADWLFSHDGKK